MSASSSSSPPPSSSPFPREAEFFGFCPLQLTDRFCAAINGRLVTAVDTFQDWACMNLVRVDEVHARALLLMASKEQLNRTGIVADADAELTSEQINQALRDVAPENDRLEAEIAAAVAAEQKEAREEEEARSNDKKKKTKKKKKNKANKRHPTLSVTAGQVLEAAANLGLDQLQNVRDLGQRMGSGVFTEVADACDRLTVGLRAMADKTCDKLELYLLNNVLRIPDDLHVPSVDNKKEDSVSTLSAPGTHMYSQEEETAIDDERAVLRDRIVRLRRKNARVARARADLHVQLEKWQSVMPLINEVTSQISKAMDSEDTENKSGTGVALSDAVMNVLRTTAQLTKKSSQVQESITRLQSKAKNRTNFGMNSTVATGKRRREKIRDILANVREGFAKRRARMTYKGDGAKLDANVVRSFGSALGIRNHLASGGD